MWQVTEAIEDQLPLLRPEFENWTGTLSQISGLRGIAGKPAHVIIGRDAG